MTALGRHNGEDFTIYYNRTDTYLGDGSGGTWFLWSCTCESDSRQYQYRTEAMMLSTAAQHIGEHAMKEKTSD